MVIGLSLLLSVQPAGAETALETCDAASVDAEVLGLCLEGLAAEVALELEQVHERAEAYFAGLDAITGNTRASRTLAQTAAAFALYRELACHLTELDQGIGSAAQDRGRACRIDHDRARIAALRGMIGNADAPPPEAEANRAPEADPAPEAEPAESVEGNLLGTIWRVTELEGEPAAAAIATTLEIDTDGAITGVGGCNRYFGAAAIGAAGSIWVSEVGATRMACAEPIMEQETRYFAALQRATGFARINGDLALTDPDGEVLARLKQQHD